MKIEEAVNLSHQYQYLVGTPLTFFKGSPTIKKVYVVSGVSPVTKEDICDVMCYADYDYYNGDTVTISLRVLCSELGIAFPDTDNISS